MANMIPNPNSQGFRFRSSPVPSEIIYIPTRLDTRTGLQVVRWKDIHRYFKRASVLMNGEDAVLFLMDDDLEDLIPLRIAHHPGVVLEVVVDTDEGYGKDISPPMTEEGSVAHDNAYSQVDSDSTYTHNYGSSINTNDGYTVFDDGLSRSTSHATIQDTTDADEDLALLDITDTVGNKEQALVVQSQSQSSHLTTSTRNNQYNTYLQTIMVGQQVQTAVIKESIDGHFDKLQDEMDKNLDLQEQLLRMQRQFETNQREMQQQQQHFKTEMLQKQQEMVQLQKQALGRLAIIQHRVQAILTQTYELHEYPIPRLFIILPKAKPRGLRGKLTTNPLVDQFRLYFLCECGAHTMTEGCKAPHEIHLAKHEGYDLDRPKEFFDKYGSYILTMMYMIKYGVMAAGIVVPPLATSKIVDGLESAQKHVEDLRKGVGSLVDETIHFLQGLQDNSGLGFGAVADLQEFEKIEVLEGADLRQLESYIKSKDEGRVLGNLFRVVTSEGHVKWVCFDHYRSNYRESVMKQLQDVVEVNGGTLTEETGKIEIKVASNTVAKQLYDAMVKARGIQELVITLQWDATTDELRTLAKAVTNANVMLLVVSWIGPYSDPKGDLLGFRRHRFDPLLKLASNGRLQSLRLGEHQGFFGRLDSHSSLAMAPKLRALHFGPEISLSGGLEKSFVTTILDSCPSLSHLSLRLDQTSNAYIIVMELLRKLSRLEALTFDCGRFSMEAVISRANLQSATMKFTSASHLSPADLDLIDMGFVEQLEVRAFTAAGADGDGLLRILKQNQGLKSLNVACLAERCYAVIELVVQARTKILEGGRTPGSCTLELSSKTLSTWSIDKRHDSDHISAVLDFPAGSKSFTIRVEAISLFAACRGGRDNFGGIYTFVDEYGYAVETISAPLMFTNEFAELLDRSTKTSGSKLKDIHLNTHELSPSGLDGVYRIIERSTELEICNLSIHRLGSLISNSESGHMDGWRERLTKLVLDLSKEELKAVDIAAIPTRNHFPNLESFELIMDAISSSVPMYLTAWIVDMVSPSPFVSPVTHDTPRRVQAAASTGSPAPWRPLKKISFRGVLFGLEGTSDHGDWTSVVKAIDFSSLEELTINLSGFSQQDLGALEMEIMRHSQGMLPLRKLRLLNVSGIMNPAMRENIRLYAPEVHIEFTQAPGKVGQFDLAKFASASADAHLSSFGIQSFYIPTTSRTKGLSSRSSKSPFRS
ncbi:hypothetical protein B0O80DRAFT_458952 [Mortierella sp. GBAus27b]|nr:hypothetical protein B0O80DRAFT_458952 [Mortierella sp. GBAus27b]